jgi:signal transduction histidine kinase/ActR/RegA family two-component response regulator
VNWPIISIGVANEIDVAAVRQWARRIAGLLGFEPQDQARIATAISEIARNAVIHAGGGKVVFSLDNASTPQGFVMRVLDGGAGIADPAAIMQGRFRGAAGTGNGIIGARRLMDGLEIGRGDGGGTAVTMVKLLPRRQAKITLGIIGEIARRLGEEASPDPVAEIREQNRELLRSLNDERARQEELASLNAELQDTNRGVVALYAELDEKAEQLRQASELKSKFLSNMTHEFRTPLNSILALSELLLDQTDGPLTDEQHRQIAYIRKSADSLTELVNDLLDIAKVEAGKLDVRASHFEITELFGALRGALRPLRTSEAVELIFDPPAGISTLFTDEAKVSQILRNFVSNALKFTERGEVRLSARRAADGGVVFAVHDTGIGIHPEHHEAIFQEFAQVENALQGRVKGTGLGLSLSRKLAELLGGSVCLDSAPNRGSTFFLALPPSVMVPAPKPSDPDRIRRILLIDDEETFRYVLRQMIGGDEFEIFEAKNGTEGLQRARALQPDAIFLDLQMPVLDGYAVLNALKADPATARARVFIATSSVIGLAERRRLRAADTILSKHALSRAAIAALLRGPDDTLEVEREAGRVIGSEA